MDCISLLCRLLAAVCRLNDLHIQLGAIILSLCTSSQPSFPGVCLLRIHDPWSMSMWCSSSPVNSAAHSILRCGHLSPLSQASGLPQQPQIVHLSSSLHMEWHCNEALQPSRCSWWLKQQYIYMLSQAMMQNWGNSQLHWIRVMFQSHGLCIERRLVQYLQGKARALTAPDDVTNKELGSETATSRE